MPDLVITITSITGTDYDGINETTKHVTATLDLLPAQPCVIEEAAVTDAICKVNYRAHLVNLGYTWSTEDGI